MFKVIVGLGNPGPQYENNRHSTGFIVIDEFAKKNGLTWKFEKNFNAEVARFEDTWLVKPMTFMNKSGESIGKIGDIGELKALQAT